MRENEIDRYERVLLDKVLRETRCHGGFGAGSGPASARPATGDRAPLERSGGKVRDIYRRGNRIALVATDRLSAFDRAITTIPLKGRILNLLSAWWFAETASILPNHVIGVPHPNVTIARACRPLPIEFVVRGHMTGSTSTSLWTHYKNGAREYCGNRIPDGLRKNDRLPRPILTPTTKDAVHDEPLSGEEAVRRGLLDRRTWERASAAALALFAFGAKTAEKAGYILADTKYEMGLDADGELILIDEIHTPDSSRFWKAESLPGRLSRGEEPESADKEFLRLWYAGRCDPYRDEILPEAPDDLRIELTRRYFAIYSALTGGREIPFDPAGEPGAGVCEALRAMTNEE
ncbi:MAG: phosphoribosylaminoimidazolesuccinocarboxamide synthase [Puniceicoccaceae bacterium]